MNRWFLALFGFGAGLIAMSVIHTLLDGAHISDACGWLSIGLFLGFIGYFFWVPIIGLLGIGYVCGRFMRRVRV